MKNAIRFPRLLHSPLFTGMTTSFIHEFLNQCAVHMYDQPTEVLARGAQVDFMYMVAHGEVEITCTNAAGHCIMLHLAGQGETFGETEVLSEKPCAATCTVAAKSTLLACSRDALRASMRSDIFMRNLMCVFHGHLERESKSRIVDQFMPLENRLNDYLYRLSANKPIISKTQADLAGLLGCARQTLNRELGQLRDQSIIQLEKGRIVVLNRDALLKGPSE